MSSLDDDEALFEDIYGDDPVDSKESGPQEGKEPGATESAASGARNDTSTQNSETPPAPAAANAPPPPPAPSSLSSGQDSAVSAPSTAPSVAPVANYPPGAPPAPPPAVPGAPQYGEYNQFQQFQQPQALPPSNMGRESGKMFIGGLNWDTTEQGLVEYFSKFGEVLDYTIMRDSATGRSRGFGFLTFKDPKSVDEVIKTDHVLDGKLIDPKRAIAREEQDKVGKIFVGGIDPLVNEKDFNDFFSQFGSIIDAQLMIDKDTGRSRGFGFITYDSPDAVDRVCVNKYLTLKGKAMEVKRAEPRGQHQQNNQPYGYNNNQYGTQYNQYGQGMQGMQGMNGMSPEMMQEYWQRMQQWYMYQQQQQQQQQQEGESGDQPAKPLNPQQQESDDRQPEAPREPKGGRGSPSRGDHGNGRRSNVPRGPRGGRAPPSGPSGGSRGRGGYNRNRGYHPYSRGGGRR